MARRTFRYSSTVKMPPPSLPPERAKVAEFYSAGSGTIPPLPWQTFPPPFSNDVITANCLTGEFIDFYGNRYRFLGPNRKAGDSPMARYGLMDLTSREIA